MWWKRENPQKIRIEPRLSMPSVFDLTDEELFLLLRLSKRPWPDNESMIDWILDDSEGKSLETKFNYMLHALSNLVVAELSKREIDKVLSCSSNQ